MLRPISSLRELELPMRVCRAADDVALANVALANAALALALL